MKVKNLIERLKRFNQNKEIVFYNDQLENMWECDIENDSSNDFEMLATSIFVYFNINGKRSHLPLNELIKQFSNLKKTRGINEKSKTKRNI